MAEDMAVAKRRKENAMKASLLFVAGLAVALSSNAPANAAHKTKNDLKVASSEIYDAAWHAKVLDPDPRRYAPAEAKTFQQCYDMVGAQGLGPKAQGWICSSMGYKR
jgi:hypothetical protein